MSDRAEASSGSNRTSDRSLVQQAAEGTSARQGNLRAAASRGRGEAALRACRRRWRRAIRGVALRRLHRGNGFQPRTAGILVADPNAYDRTEGIANAGVLMQAGGAIRLDQAEFTRERLPARSGARAGRRLARDAMAAKSMADRRPERLANWCLRWGGIGTS